MYIIDALINNWRDILSYIIYAYLAVVILVLIFAKGE